MDHLLAQVARHDWFNVALDLEHQKIKDILEVAGSINAIVSERDSRYQERMVSNPLFIHIFYSIGYTHIL